MDPKLYRLLLAITVAAAEELAQAGQADRGVRLIREFREKQGDHKQKATDGLLRFAFLHCEAAEMKALNAWEGRNASSSMARKCMTTLGILDGKPVPDEELRVLELSVVKDWLWHYPLGFAAWNSFEPEKAWDHFHRYYVFSEKDGHKGGLFQRMSWAFLVWYRDCQVCQRAPAEVHHRPSPRFQILALCHKCKALATDKELLASARDPNIDKNDLRLTALSKLTQLFDFRGRCRSPRPTRNQWKRLKTRLHYHRVPTLEGFLDEECREIYAQAGVTAREHGLEELDSCCLLVHVLRALEHEEFQGEVQFQTRESIGSDEIGALRDVLNIARWLAVLGPTKSSKIDLVCLLRALSFAERGRAAALMDEHGVSRLDVPTDCTEAQRKDVQSLRARLRLRFLVALEHALSGYEGQMWLIENEPKISFVGSPGKQPEQRAAWLIMYRDALRRRPVDPVFTNAWINIGATHGDLNRKLLDFGYQRLGNPAFLDVLYVTPSSQKRLLASKHLEICKERLEIVDSPVERTVILWTCRELARVACQYREWERYILLDLDNPSTARGWDWEHHRIGARRELVEVALAQKNYELAFQRLLDCAADCPRDCERDLIRLAQEFWRVGYRVQFHEVLDRLKERPNPDLSLINETQDAYKTMGSIWSKEDVERLQPKFLDPL